MNTKEFTQIIAQYEEHSPQRLRDILAELELPGIAAGTAAATAYNAYFADVKRREETITAKIQSLETEILEIDRKLDKQKATLVEATLAGDDETAKRLQAEYSVLSDKRLSLSGQKKLLSSSDYVPGDSKLYTAAEAAFSEFIETQKKYKDAKRAVFELAYKCADEWKFLEDWSVNYDIGGGSGPNMEKMRAHFHQYQKQTHTDSPEPRSARVNLETNRYVVNDRGTR